MDLVEGTHVRYLEARYELRHQAHIELQVCKKLHLAQQLREHAGKSAIEALFSKQDRGCCVHQMDGNTTLQLGLRQREHPGTTSCNSRRLFWRSGLQTGVRQGSHSGSILDGLCLSC